MEIVQLNLKIREEIKKIIDTIYAVFLACNKNDSTERLIERMRILYGPWYDYASAIVHFQETNIFFIAKENDGILGVVRWTPEKLTNLFIPKEQQWKWVGKKLLDIFEEEAKKMWSTVIRLKSSKYALPFNLKNGYTVEQDNRLIKYL